MKRIATLGALAALAGALWMARPAPANTSCQVVGGKKILVTLRVAFRGADEALTTHWVREIVNVWNGPTGSQRYPGCNCRVFFYVDAQTLKPAEAFPKGWHWVDVRDQVRTPEGRPAVAYMGRTLPSPSYRGESIDGEWSTRTSKPSDREDLNDSRNKQAAHEAGHMMGLPDYYSNHIRWHARNIMGGPSEGHDAPTPEMIAQIVDDLTGLHYCPVCRPPQKLSPLKPVLREGLAPGLGYVAHPARAEPTRLGPLRNGVARTVDLAGLDKDTAWEATLFGYIRVPAEGCYSFSLGSDGPARLTIGDRVVTWDAGSDRMAPWTGEVTLQAGLHPIELTSATRPGGAGPARLLLRYSGPGVAETPVPESALFHAADGR